MTSVSGDIDDVCWTWRAANSAASNRCRQANTRRSGMISILGTIWRVSRRWFWTKCKVSLIEVANTGRSENHLRSLTTAAQEAFEISQLQYCQGVADFLTVLQVQQTLFSAEDQLAQTVLANLLASVHLYQALGGGWAEKLSLLRIVAGLLISPLGNSESRKNHTRCSAFCRSSI
jgi:hypothetical protein